MYKLFRTFGLILIVVASFIYTEKLVNVVSEYDELMVQIKENKDNFKIQKKEAVIKDDTIIPGVSGKKVEIKKSYTKMRQYGKYNEKLYVYKTNSPKERLEENKDKYIIKGNKENKVALIIDEKYINDVIKYNEKVTFNITNNWYKNNKQIVTKLVDKGYIFMINNKYIKTISNQKNGYCYTEEKNKELLKECMSNDNYTILPNIIIKDNSLIKLEKQIDSGSIISVKSNNYLNIIRYIKNKGYEIVSIEELVNDI